MPDQTEQRRGRIPLNSFLSDFRSSLTDHELRERYGLSARNFISLIKSLLERNIISTEDLARRKEMAVKRDLAKESEFLSGLFICPNCSHPHPVRFEVCPACGIQIVESDEQKPQEVSITTSGDHLYVQDGGGDEIEVTVSEDDELPPTELIPAMPEPEKTGSQKSPSLVRSFLSKLKKK